MAFVNLIFTAQRLKKLKNTLQEEKLEAIKAHDDKSYKKKFKFRHIGVDIREGIKNALKKAFGCTEKSRGYKTCYKLGREGSYENFILKSVLGFISGIFLTYFLYIVFIFQLNVKLTSATIVCSILGCILTVGLAFSSNVRCIVLLTLPQFFSKRGRQALLAYAFVLALTGPAQNTLNNIGILSDSLACGQQQLKSAVKQIIDVIKKPFMAIKDAIKKVIKAVKEIVKKIKEILLKIKRVIMALVRVIKSAFEFIGKIINICNKELGTPFERCSRVFETAIADCNAKLGPLFNWLCSLAYIVKAVCYIVKPFDFVCMLVDFISNSVVGVVIKKVKIFVRHIKTMFYVRIKFAHKFEYKMVASKSMKEISKEIVAEVKERTSKIMAFFNFMTSASMLFFLYIVFQVSYYRISFLTRENFDNIYINKYFREIDQRRAKFGKETILPLTKKEQVTYVPIDSAKLSKTERRSLSKSATKLATVSIKLAIHLMADYSLYWILSLISHHARYQSKVQAPNFPVAHIAGEGFLAVLLRAVVNAFQPVGIKLEIDTVPCLPIPIPPDYDRYVQIAITILICWILTLLEPYGLRFRNYIMGYYYPLRAKQRTIWLYNNILRSRVSFLTLTRRMMRRQFGSKGRPDEISCKDWLRAKLRCSIFKICLGSNQKTCLLCGEIFREKEKTRFIKCQTPDCPGLFCLECFADLNNICPVCLSPVDCGDLEDLDEEKDSSGDEPPPPPQPKRSKKKLKCPWLPCEKPDDDDQQPLVSEDEDDHTEDHSAEEPSEQDKVAEESDSSTDYSYSYQYDDSYTPRVPFEPSIEWRDVEKQDMPDEASMESFRESDECLCIDFDNQLKVPKDHVAQVKLDIVAELSEDDDEEIINEDEPLLILDDKEVTEDHPAFEQCNCSLPSTSRRVEFIGVPDTIRDGRRCICSDINLLKSTMSTSTRSDCKFCKCSDVDIQSNFEAGTETEEELRNIVPKLDLSFLKTKEEISKSKNPSLSQRFSHTTYKKECEIPFASNRSLESSSVLSSLQRTPVVRKRNVRTSYNPPPEDSSTDPNDSTPPPRKKKNAKTQYTPPEIESPSSMNSFEFGRAQQKKVRKYYETTKPVCDDRRCQHGRKRRSITEMFRRILPRRNSRQQTYLPLHRRDIHEDIQIQSYNYNRQNWDTLSLDTDSPTYPFASQLSVDSSEEDQLLGGPRRIRGGECTHLINCRLIGRECTEKKVRSFDAKSEFILGRTRLKDFSTLSLPPRPKPADHKELFLRYFSNTGSLLLNQDTKVSMKTTESTKRTGFQQNLSDRGEISDYIITKDAVSSLGPETTPPSSESGLSENTCQALFGNPYPQGFNKSSLEAVDESEVNIVANNNIGYQEEDITKESDQEEDVVVAIEENSANTVDEANLEEKEEVTSEQKKFFPLVIEAPTTSFEAEPLSAVTKEESIKQSKQNSSSNTQIETTVSKKKSAQLNQLLYKDHRTEISLVQRLSPRKSKPTNEEPVVLKPAQAPSVKLKIALHNSIIPEADADIPNNNTESTPIAMISQKSQDKIVETQDSFPLQPHWNPSDNSKLILSSDKNQQTSDNNIYQSRIAASKNASLSSSSARPLLSSATHHPSTSSRPYYSTDLPERDGACKNNCKCSICQLGSNINQKYPDVAQYNRPAAEESCSCCKCSKGYYQEQTRPRPSPYQFTMLPPSTTDTEMPNYLLPPPPPRPPLPPRHPLRRTSAPHQRQLANYRRCLQQCECCLRHGDYNYPYAQYSNFDEYNNYSSTTDANLSDLPYQNSEDYLELVDELQDTLHTRNRNRVKRAMQEFEDKSKQNKPLDKPIIDYDETSESEEPLIRKIDKLRIERNKCCSGDKCGCSKEYARYSKPKRVDRDDRPSHWTMDPTSGEWQKAYKHSKRRAPRGSKEEHDFEHCTCNCNCRYQ